MKTKLPSAISIFPLNGAIFFPRTNLPLNIFEKRYVTLIKDCLNKDKLFGMIQTKKNNSKQTYSIGCLGKITDCVETKDNRFLINLYGICRFKTITELNNNKLYREFSVDYAKFSHDTENEKESKIFAKGIISKSKLFFEKKGFSIDWKDIKLSNNIKKIDTLIMILPFSNEEKQLLLETVKVPDRVSLLNQILNFYLSNYDESLNLQ